MFNMLKAAAIAGLIGLVSLAATTARADGIYLNFGEPNARFGVHIGDGGSVYHPLYRHGGDYRPAVRRCTPERALYKARRIGVHRARIDYVSRHQIGVVGRSRGERVRLTFARAPNCPIIG